MHMQSIPDLSLSAPPPPRRPGDEASTFVDLHLSRMFLKSTACLELVATLAGHVREPRVAVPRFSFAKKAFWAGVDSVSVNSRQYARTDGRTHEQLYFWYNDETKILFYMICCFFYQHVIAP